MSCRMNEHSRGLNTHAVKPAGENEGEERMREPFISFLRSTVLTYSVERYLPKVEGPPTVDSKLRRRTLGRALGKSIKMSVTNEN